MVLDVRRKLEWEESHVAGATHIPFTDLPGRLDDVPAGEVWVHCQSGYRAMVAASLLAAGDRDVTSVNDHFSNAVVSRPRPRGWLTRAGPGVTGTGRRGRISSGRWPDPG